MADLHIPDAARAAELRSMVREFRADTTTEARRRAIQESWVKDGTPNQFAAMLRAGELDPPQSGGDH